MSRAKLNLYFMYLFLVVFLLIAVAAAGIFLYSEPESVLDEYDYGTFQEMVSVAATEYVEDKPAAFMLDYDYAGLIELNSDFAGWLMIPDTVVSFPVVYAEDNNYYLNRSFSGEYNQFGCLFFDKNTEGRENRVIHGHNMGVNRTEMFSSLIDFQDAEFAEAHKYFYLSEAPEVTEKYCIFAVVNFDTNYIDECNYLQNSFSSPEDRTLYVQYLKEQSLYETDFFPEGEILILSTCNRAYGAANRLIICAGKVDNIMEIP